MNFVERLSAAFFLGFCAWALRPALPWRVRARVPVIAATGLALLFLPRLLRGIWSEGALAVLTDCLPAPLMLVAYWQAGQCFVAPWGEFQSWLARLDSVWLGEILHARREGRIPRWLLSYLELTYALCYPLVPAALGTLYLLGQAAHAGRFWEIVLPPSFACYAMVPLVQTLPPRALEPELAGRASASVRGMNLWILRHGSIQANTFPSAHVAASLAAALALLEVSPVAGAVFLWLAVSIASAAVICRYHYALDVLIGALLALLSFSGHRMFLR